MGDDYKTISEQAAFDAYDEWLNEQWPVQIGDLIFDASDVLKELDPIAYRVGLSDFLDAQGLEVA